LLRGRLGDVELPGRRHRGSWCPWRLGPRWLVGHGEFSLCNDRLIMRNNDASAGAERIISTPGRVLATNESLLARLSCQKLSLFTQRRASCFGHQLSAIGRRLPNIGQDLARSSKAPIHTTAGREHIG
jgi:hypothetical protein